MSKEEIIGFIKEEIGKTIQKEPATIDDHTNFMRIGVSSVQALKIINKMRKKLSIDINPVAMFEYKTIADFSGYLSECTVSQQ